MFSVHKFKANFSTAEINADNEPERLATDVVLHDTDSFVRNVCFVWEDGRKAFFNYAYLLSVDLFVNESVNILRLYFGSYTVSLKGYNLELLFGLLMSHNPKIITAVDLRYVLKGYKLAAFVTDIIVEGE